MSKPTGGQRGPTDDTLELRSKFRALGCIALRRAAICAALALPLIHTSACVHVCKEGGCESMLWVYVSEVDDVPLRDGTYELRLTRDGAAASAFCDVTDEAESVDCDDGLSNILYAPLSGATLGPHRRFEFHVRGDLPTELTVRVAVDDVVLLEETFQPEYVNPDPGCFDDCLQADHAFTLPP